MQITFPIWFLALAFGGSFLVGFFACWLKIKNLRNQILELEKEKMADHAEILELQRSIASLQRKEGVEIPNSISRIVSLKEKATESTPTTSPKAISH